jgi:AmiR/NasT family two-component response regulator
MDITQAMIHTLTVEVWVNRDRTNPVVMLVDTENQEIVHTQCVDIDSDQVWQDLYHSAFINN